MDEDAEEQTTYTDSRGVEVQVMTFSEALEIVHDLATQNQIDDNDIDHGDDGLVAQRDWQSTALSVVHDLVVNHEDSLDGLEHPKAAGDWGVDVLMADRSADADEPPRHLGQCTGWNLEGNGVRLYYPKFYRGQPGAGAHDD